MRLTDRWHLDRRLGRGGMAEVWLARHARLGLPAAIKLLLEPALRGPALRRRLQAEIRVVAALQHPNIVDVLDQGVADATDAAQLGCEPGTPWVALEYLAGGDLDARRGRLGWDTLAPILAQVLDALGHAHARGLLHLDVKPANVLVSPHDGRCCLADFGITRTVRDAGRSVLGSPGYMAPEQERPGTGPIGPWTDLYALGVTATRLLDPAAPRPPAADAWLAAMTAPQPCDRPTTAADARAALGQTPRAAPPRAGLAAATEPTGTATSTTATHGARPAVATGWVAPRSPIVWPETPPAPRPSRWPAASVVALRDPPVHGRDAELRRAWSVLGEAAATGRPRVLLVGGPPGAGAAHFAAAVCAAALEAGAWPGWHTSLGGGAEALASLVTDVGRRVGVAGSAYVTLRAAAGPRPWLVRVDEADRGLEAAKLAGDALDLADDLPSALVAVLVASRPAGEVAAWRRLVGRPGVHVVDLGPLDPEAWEELLRDRLGVAPALRDALRARYGTWPAPAVRWVRDAARDDRLVETGNGLDTAEPPTFPAGGEVAAALLAWRGQRSEAEQAALARWGAWGRALHPGLGVGDGLLDAMVAAGWAVRRGEDWVLAHPDHVAALAAGATGADHALCAALLADDTSLDARERRAEHLYRAGDAAAARPLLIEAIDARLGRLEPDRAARLIDTLAACGGDPAAIASRRSRAWWSLGRYDDAAAAAKVAIEGGATGDDAAHALRTLGMVLSGRGDPEAEVCLRRAAEVATSAEAVSRGLFHLGTFYARRGRDQDAIAAYGEALAAAPRGGLRADCLQQLGELRRVAGDLDGALALLDQAVAARGEESGPTTNGRAVLLRSLARHDEAIVEAHRAVALYLRSGVRPPFQPFLCEGLSRWALGDAAGARVAFAHGLARAASGTRPAAEGAMHAVSIAPCLALGDVAQAEVHVAGAESRLLGSGEADLDVLALLEAAASLAPAALAARIAALADDQRRRLTTS